MSFSALCCGSGTLVTMPIYILRNIPLCDLNRTGKCINPWTRAQPLLEYTTMFRWVLQQMGLATLQYQGKNVCQNSKDPSSNEHLFNHIKLKQHFRDLHRTPLSSKQIWHCSRGSKTVPAEDNRTGKITLFFVHLGKTFDPCSAGACYLV